MFISAFIFGLLGSFHCLGMCGPIAFMLPVDRQNPTKRFFQITSYHFGRLFSYSLIGLLFGMLGSSFYFLGFQQQLSIIVGGVMVLIILFPRLKFKNKLNQKLNSIIIKLKSKLGKELKNKRNDTFFMVGFLNGFLPCGLVYMAVLGALVTNSILESSFYMLLFGLGTIPLMTTFVYLGNFTKGAFKKNIQKAIPVVVFCIGVLFIVRGLGLDIPFLSPNPVISSVGNSVSGCH